MQKWETKLTDKKRKKQEQDAKLHKHFTQQLQLRKTFKVVKKILIL